jgi:carbohydrate ABC transporter ATP-binding protein
MRTEISRLQRRLGITTIYVTHDQTEAMTLGDRVAVLKRGLLQQCASPRELYEEPINLFVAGFIGSPPMNFLPATVQEDHLELPMVKAPIPENAREALAGKKVVIVGLRPEHIKDADVTSPPEDAVSFSSVIDVTEWLGNEQYAYIPFQSDPSVQSTLEELDRDLDGEGMRTQFVVNLDPRSQILEGEEASLYFMPNSLMVFDPETGRNLTRDENNAQRIAERSEAARKRALERARA